MSSFCIEGKVLGAGTADGGDETGGGSRLSGHAGIAGRKARDLQSQTVLLDDPRSSMRLPFGGHGAVCERSEPRQKSAAAGDRFSGLHVEPTAARFEDGFMILLARAPAHPPDGGRHADRGRSRMR
jgi:hypothetical protein